MVVCWWGAGGGGGERETGLRVFLFLEKKCFFLSVWLLFANSSSSLLPVVSLLYFFCSVRLVLLYQNGLSREREREKETGKKQKREREVFRQPQRGHDLNLLSSIIFYLSQSQSQTPTSQGASGVPQTALVSLSLIMSSSDGDFLRDRPSGAEV